MLKILSNLLKEFDKEDISYCVFKGVEHLKNDIKGGGKDIDLLIDYLDYQNKRLDLIMKKNQFFRVIWPPRTDGILFYLGFDIEEEKEILIHVYSKLRIGPKKYQQYHWEVEEKILKNRILKSFSPEGQKIWVINPEDEFCLMLLRSIIKQNNYKEEDLRRLNQLRHQIVTFQNGLLPPSIEALIGEESSSFLLSIDFTSNRLKELSKIYKAKVISSLLKKRKEQLKAFYRIYYAQFLTFLGFFRRRLGYPAYQIRKKGILVVFLGIDGSGKTTQIAKTMNNTFLKISGIKRYYGGNNEYWIPFISTQILKFGHVKNPNIVLKIYLRTLSYISLLDRRLRVIPAFFNVIKGKVVVFDRYFYDDMTIIIKNQDKNLKKLKKWHQKILKGWLGWTPDLTFFLDVDANESFKRKKEHTLEILNEQSKAYKKLLFGRKEVIFIDATKDIQEINKIIISCIFQKTTTFK